MFSEDSQVSHEAWNKIEKAEKMLEQIIEDLTPYDDEPVVRCILASIGVVLASFRMPKYFDELKDHMIVFAKKQRNRLVEDKNKTIMDGCDTNKPN